MEVSPSIIILLYTNFTFVLGMGARVPLWDVPSVQVYCFILVSVASGSKLYIGRYSMSVD